MARRVKHQVVDLEDGVGHRGATPCQGPDARRQLGEGKGLREVVICTRVKTFDSVLNRIKRGQHEDGGRVAALAHALTHLGAAGGGEHAVEDDDVELAGLEHVQGVAAIPDYFDGVTFALQDALHQLGQLCIVFYDQNV